MIESRHTGSNPIHGPKNISLTGTAKSDHLSGGKTVADIKGRAGDDVLHAGIFGGTVSGGHGNDRIHLSGFGANQPQQFQTHAYGDWGNDTFYLNVARQTDDNHNLRFGHHVFGGHGADRFVFKNVNINEQKIIGRIDDFNYSEDTIWIDNKIIDFSKLPENVRIVEYKDQQWILINERILYALEGARHASSAVPGDDRNAGGSEENHFIDWPAEWANGAPKSANVPYISPINFVPKKFLLSGFDYDQTISPQKSLISGTLHSDRIEGSSIFNLMISGGDGNDFIFGNRGNDTINGDKGDDYIDGGLGHDKLLGGYRNDTIDGNKGHDTIYGGDGNDITSGGSDNDKIHGGNGDDTIFGGSEDDVIFGDDGKDFLWGGSGNDTIYGGRGVDTIHGGTGNDRIFGGEGDDLIPSSSGDDWLHGGEGKDTIHGGPGHDIIRGDYGNDIIYGNRGSDRLFGGLGNDTLYGGAGMDFLHGGVGNDTFIFKFVNDSRAGKNIDRMVGFSPSEDKLCFSDFDANLKLVGTQKLRLSDGPDKNSLWLSENKFGTYVRIDVNGDDRQEFAVLLEGVYNIGHDFFIL